MVWNDVFKLPEKALAGDKCIPKAKLVAQAGLTKREQKLLDKVAALTYFAAAEKRSVRILPCIDEDRDVQSVLFLRCEMRGASKAYSEVAALLHKCFPNPTVVLFEGLGSVCISVALTRKSLTEKGATIIEKIEGTGAFVENDPVYAPFLASLEFDELSQDNLYSFVSEIAWKVRLSRLITTLGFFPICSEADRTVFERLAERFELLSREEAEVSRARRAEDLSMNEKANLRMKQKGLQVELAEVLVKIKEICNG